MPCATRNNGARLRMSESRLIRQKIKTLRNRKAFFVLTDVVVFQKSDDHLCNFFVSCVVGVQSVARIRLSAFL